MEKFIKLIENLAPIISSYPKSAQILFIVTGLFVFMSFFTFLFLMPSTKDKIQNKGASILNESSFAVTSPKAGVFLANKQLTIHGTGADSKRDNSIKVQLTHIPSGKTQKVQGDFIVNSDKTWRFSKLEFGLEGAYDILIEAIFDGKRFSQIVRINFELAESTEKIDKKPTFIDNDSFKVLILPFEALEISKLRESRYGKAVEKRLVELSEQEGLNLAIAYQENEKSPVGFKQASDIGTEYNADLVIWGDYYEKVHSDSTHATVKYALLNIRPPNVSVKGKTPITEIQSLTLVSQGFLQHDIDYILYWVIALEKFSSEKYEEALPLFVRVKEKFADKFAGILSFKMNEQGFSFRANLPAIQLFYNLAYTLSMNDKYDESIKYWSELLTGGSTKGGSMMVYDTLMVAISIKNHDAVKLCAFALFNRALAYQQIGMFEEAKNDYEKLVTVSSQSEILKSYIQPIEDFINQQLKMNTDETNK